MAVDKAEDNANGRKSSEGITIIFPLLFYLLSLFSAKQSIMFGVRKAIHIIKTKYTQTKTKLTNILIVSSQQQLG